MLKAVTRSARSVDQRVASINADRASRGQGKISVAYYFDHYGTDEDTQVTVVEDDFMRAREELVPSVSVDELRHYERVRNTFEGATKKEDANNADGEGTPMSANGPATMQSRALDGMKRASKNKVPTMNGGPHSPHQHASSPSSPTKSNTVRTAAGPDDEDYVIRTDNLSLNDNMGQSYIGKGKGKGKGRGYEMGGPSPSGVAGNTSDGINNNGDVLDQPDGEDLYD